MNPIEIVLSLILLLLLLRVSRRTFFPNVVPGLKPMPVCVGDPEAPNGVFQALYTEFNHWENVSPEECSVFVLVPTEEGYFHPEDVETARHLRAFNQELRLVAYDRTDRKLRGLTLLEIEANIGVA